MSRITRDVEIIHEHAPHRRSLKATQHIDQRRLPRSVRADQPEDVPALKRQVDLIKCPDSLELDDDPL